MDGTDYHRIVNLVNKCENETFNHIVLAIGYALSDKYDGLFTDSLKMTPEWCHDDLNALRRRLKETDS
jgi:hypothetical protein